MFRGVGKRGGQQRMGSAFRVKVPVEGEVRSGSERGGGGVVKSVGVHFGVLQKSV